MTGPIQHKTVEDFLNDFRGDDNIRSVILTSSRARNDSSVDRLSDYDIELYVTSLEYFLPKPDDIKDPDSWFENRGDVLVKWPLIAAADGNRLTRLVQFADGLRIDFQIYQGPPRYHETFDAGYIVLIDKDGAAAEIKAPEEKNLLISKPNEALFTDRVNAFLWDSLYVPKALLRGEEFYALSMMADLHLRFIRNFTEWKIGARSDWKVGANKQGRWFRAHLSSDEYRELLMVIDGRSFDSYWSWFDATMKYCRELLVELAARLGFPFPETQYGHVTQYIESMAQDGEIQRL